MAAMGNAAKRPRRLARTREDMESPGERLPCRPTRLKDSCTAMESCERPDSAPPRKKLFGSPGLVPRFPTGNGESYVIRKVEKAASRETVLGLLEPLVARWFGGECSGLTEPHAYALPLIHEGRNVLVSSPTGSGKTLTAFLTVLNELYALQKRGKLEDRIYAVYVSPLKALANDINRNLEEPLREMTELAANAGEAAPEIRVGVRSGDTSASERQRQARRPPHIFITTPESLAIVLSAPKFREKFRGVRWVIVDEIHEVCSSKRGALLSVTLERLQEQIPEEFTRIGLRDRKSVV